MDPIRAAVRDGRIAGSLPIEITSYVGREAMLVEGVRLLGSAPVVTLTGPGGVGKTRLAAQVAERASATFADGVVYVPLAELHEPELLIPTLAECFGLSDRSARPAIDTLIDTLRERRTLLVLDNCEHLLGACAQVVDKLVQAVPGLVVLTTSRQSIGVAGERILPVPPLGVPEQGEPVAGLTRYDSVRLFLDRATAVVSTFEITAANASHVIDLCQQLDGLPLAIELAAVRLRSLSISQLVERLTEQLTLPGGSGRRLGPRRHRTLWAMVDWSHQLCTEPERLLWARASVFAGGFDLAAAETVCSGDGVDSDGVLDVIDRLIDKSILLREEQQGVVRYRMLETIRQYGLDLLDSAGELPALRRRHRDWYAALLDRFQADSIGPDQLVWLGRLRHEHANLRMALDFSAGDPAEAVVGLRMANAVCEYWRIRGTAAEGRMQLRRLLDAAPEDAPGRADGFWNTAFLALIQSDLPAYEAALATARVAANGDPRALAYVDHVRAYAALIGNDMPVAAELFGSAAEVFVEHGDLVGMLWAKYNYGIATALAGDLDRGRLILHESIDAYAERGEVAWRSWAIWSLGATEYLAGDLQKGSEACRDVLRLQQRIDDRTIIAFALTVMAGCLAHGGQDRRCARLFGAATTVWQSLGATPTTYAAFVEPIKKDTDAVVGRLGLDRTREEFAVGSAMSTAEAIAYALAEPEQTEPAAPPNPLTKREQEIAELVATGMTNREIATALVISQRTAETHVDHILTKLGFTNRAQIAAWVAGSPRP